MSKHRLQPLLKPSSIAVIGASQKTGSVGNEVFKNLKRGGFEGELVGVNPGYTNIEGQDCYPLLKISRFFQSTLSSLLVIRELRKLWMMLSLWGFLHAPFFPH